ncbi:ATP-binding protein [Clostridium hydrogenum]|uniref:ATP-binding protein n=1 Tax=Clostridium hydrogenum TaxID=2855764 RepID=UPI001F440B4E|nr:ATP-binding protein [Clostridium hydrogenum]
MEILPFDDCGEYLNKLIIYRDILKDPVISLLKNFLDESFSEKHDREKINSLYYELSSKLISAAENYGLSGNLLKSYIGNCIVNYKNYFTKACEKYEMSIEKCLYLTALNDIKILYSLLNLNIGTAFDQDYTLFENYIPTLNKPSIGLFNEKLNSIINSSSPEYMLKKIIKYYFEVGSGEMSNAIAFRWENGLTPVKDYDYLTFSDIIGYDYQKETLIKNTNAFVNGHTANNVLLIGSRGTGKSSSVKALVTEFYSSGLRLVEITKSQLLCFPDILKELKSRGKYFIIFIDDLSFEEGEIEYKQMKSFLDGGIEKLPSNVLVYATSNRRHLIKETWGDRNQDSEEIHSSDTVNEKLSLSDRFGIKLTYITPSQNEYFKIVEELAKKQNLNISVENLRSEAVKWAASQNGRSGRTAKQFVNSLAE